MKSYSLLRLFLGLVLFVAPGQAFGWSSLISGGHCRQTKRSCRSTVDNGDACCGPLQQDVKRCEADNVCDGRYKLYWEKSNLPLKWYFSPSGTMGKYGFTGFTQAAVLTEIKRAWDAWTKPPCSAFRHAYQGVGAEWPKVNDRLVVFFPSPALWAYYGLPANVLAFSSPSALGFGAMRDADIVVNPKPVLNWGLPPVAPDRIDFTQVLTHEVGHSIGFAHSASDAAIMWYALRSNGASFQGLKPDDVKAVCSVYPAENVCSSDAECGTCYECKSGKCAPPAPPIAKNCRTCQTDTDCGPRGLCVDLPEGGRCLQACSTQGCCPPGYRCASTPKGKLCVPIDDTCPYTRCNTDAECGRDSVCESTYGTCVSKGSDAYHLCHNACSKDADCGDPKFQCAGIVGGVYRCLEKCPFSLCPKGFICRPNPKGNHCFPFEINYCPCRTPAHCGADTVCVAGNCVPKVADYGQPCGTSFPCKKEQVCVEFITGARCSYDCSPTMPCPKGLVCGYVPGLPQRCVNPPNASLGETCDGVNKRCKAGLICMRVSSLRKEAYCVEECNITTPCPSGGKCDLNHLPTFCECSSDGDCAKGLVCSTLGAGYRVCACLQSPCQKPCGNGVCEEKQGENCTSCPADCQCESGYDCTSGICRRSTNCGDALCNAERGENCSVCLRDCPCAPGLVCAAGQCVQALKCGDGICSPARNETCESCPGDCPCAAGAACQKGQCVVTPTKLCGNGVCEPGFGESCDNCPADCACGTNATCVAGTCSKQGGTIGCGNGICEPGANEDCITCKADCGCQNRQVCNKGLCVSADEFCPPVDQQLTCEPGGRNCVVVCRRGGCACHQTPNQQTPLALFLLCFLLLSRLFTRARAQRT